MIDWINAYCREWGDARYYIDNCNASPTSVWGRINEGWSIAAADSMRRPDPPEVMLNGALAVSIAIKKAIEANVLTERQFRVLYVHYVERASTKRKMDAVGLSKKRYYEILHKLHRVIRRYLPEEHQRRTPGDFCVGDNGLLVLTSAP